MSFGFCFDLLGVGWDDCEIRKTNTDPEKVDWQLSAEDSIALDSTVEDEPFVAPVDFGHEDFVHDWSLTPHAAV